MVDGEGLGLAVGAGQWTERRDPSQTGLDERARHGGWWRTLGVESDLVAHEDVADARPGEDVVTTVQEYGTTAYGWAMEDSAGFVKLVADRRSGQLLGAHIMGHEASLLIQPLIQALSFGLDVASMARGQYWIHPALAEVVENALLSLGIDDRPDRT